MLTTDAKIIPLIRRRVAFFPTAAARQFSTAITAESVRSKRSQIETERLQVEHSTVGIGRAYA